MYRSELYFIALCLLLVLCQAALAAEPTCSYSKIVQRGGLVFDVRSRPAGGCGVQIVTVTAMRAGKKVAAMKTDADQVPKSAKAVDLDGDGTPELVLTSLVPGGMAMESLDIYRLDGATLQHSTIPELEDKSGYRGGDRFKIEGHLIVRTFPVYLDGDQDGKPTGGSRSLKYGYKEGALTLSAMTEKSEAPPSSASQNVPDPVKEVSAPPEPVVSATAALTITEIIATEAGIAILSNSAITKYKTMRLKKPERIAIDMPGADSPLAGKKIAIERFGINRARIGRNKGFLRVVLDTDLDAFPKFEIKPSATGVQIEFPK